MTPGECWEAAREAVAAGRIDAVLALYAGTSLEAMPPHAALLVGRCLLRKPDPLAAIAYLARAAEPLGPRNEQADAHALLGRIHAGVGQDVAAVEHFRAVLALRPGQDEATVLLGQALARLGWPDLALARYARLTGPLGGPWRAMIAAAQRDLATARRTALKALAARRGGTPPAPAVLLRALIRCGRLRIAARLLEALPPDAELRVLAAKLRLRERQGLAGPGLRRALLPLVEAGPALRIEAAQALQQLGATEEAAEALAGVPETALDSTGLLLRAQLLLAQGESARLETLSAAALAARPRRIDLARQLLTARLVEGRMTLWHGPDPTLRPAASRLPLVQFWPGKEPPEPVRAALDGWVRHHPTMKLARFDDASARAFILAQQGAEGGAAFDACRTPALRANMLRLVFLATHGGLWVDADAHCLRPLDEVLVRLPGLGLIATCSSEFPFYLHNAMLAAPPGSTVMRRLVEEQARTMRAALDGSAPLEDWGSNGPGLVTRVLMLAPEPLGLLDQVYWRSFAADAAGRSDQRDGPANRRLMPRGVAEAAA